MRVIPTKSIPEGYSALSMMNLWADTVEELVDDMSMNLDNVTAGHVTAAIRDTGMDAMDVKKGDFIGLADKHIVACEADRVSAAKALIRKVTAEKPRDVIIVFWGEQVSQDEVDALSAFLTEEYPLVDTGFVEGKQSVYDFIISME